MLKSPSIGEKTSRRSLTKLMKRKLSFRMKDRTENEDFGGISIILPGKKKNKLPKGLPREIVFKIDWDDYDDEVSLESQFKDIPDLVPAETPIKKSPLQSSESSGSEHQTIDWVQSISDRLQSVPGRFPSLQNSLFAHRKGLLAVAVAALFCSQVPGTTKLQLSVFAAGLSSTIMEQSITLVTYKLPKMIRETSNFVSNEDFPEESHHIIIGGLSCDESSEDGSNVRTFQEQVAASGTSENQPDDRIKSAKSEESVEAAADYMQWAVTAEGKPADLSLHYAKLRDDKNVAIDGSNNGADAESSGIFLSRLLQGIMPEKNENGIIVQSTTMVQQEQDSTNTIIVQNNIAIPEGSKGTIIVQLNIEGASIQAGPDGYMSAAAPSEIASGVRDELDHLDPDQVVRRPLADDELPPECYNVFKKVFSKGCKRTAQETESKERKWIEALLIDAWVLNMDL